jgi:hypothetical protein
MTNECIISENFVVPVSLSYMYVCIHTYIYIYIYTYTHTDIADRNSKFSFHIQDTLIYKDIKAQHSTYDCEVKAINTEENKSFIHEKI